MIPASDCSQALQRYQQRLKLYQSTVLSQPVMEYDVRRRDQQGRILHDCVLYTMLLIKSQSIFAEEIIKQATTEMIEVSEWR